MTDPQKLGILFQDKNFQQWLKLKKLLIKVDIPVRKSVSGWLIDFWTLKIDSENWTCPIFTDSPLVLIKTVAPERI